MFVGLIPDTHYTAEVIANVGNIKSSPGQAADTTGEKIAFLSCVYHTL